MLKMNLGPHLTEKQMRENQITSILAPDYVYDYDLILDRLKQQAELLRIMRLTLTLILTLTPTLTPTLTLCLTQQAEQIRIMNCVWEVRFELQKILVERNDCITNGTRKV